MSYQEKLFIRIRGILKASLCAIVFAAVLWHASVAQAATLAVSPATAQTSVGKTFTVSVVVNSAGQSINAVDGQISFSNSVLELVGISKNGILNLWAQDPTYSNTAGTASFQGVVLNGYTGDGATVASLTFKAIAQGTGTISISGTSSSVLLNDGNGTDALSGTTGASITVGPAVAKPASPTTQSSAPTAPANAPSTALATTVAPVFTAYQNPLLPGSFVVAKGTAAPNTTVGITFTDSDRTGTATISQSQVAVNSSGQFVFVSNSTAVEGHTYSIVATTPDGKSTKTLVLNVKNSLWFTLKTWIITFILLKVSILLVIALLLIALYLLHQNVILKKHLKALKKT